MANFETTRDNILALKEAGHRRFGEFRDYALSYWSISREGLYYYYHDENRRYRRNDVTWEEMTQEELENFDKIVDKHFPKNIVITRDRFLIKFYNKTTGETMACNLKDQKFTKTYKNGKERDVVYPNTFFKGYLGNVVIQNIPTDDNFKKLMEVIAAKNYLCSNFGTFLVRMFDNFHLETYISANKPFSDRINVPLNFFPKEIRTIVDEKGLTYDTSLESFFANDMDLGRTLFYCIKDSADFDNDYKVLAGYMNNVVTLCQNYNYDAKTLFFYCKERGFKSERDNYSYWQSTDLFRYMNDYARMAESVCGLGRFEKYPKDLKKVHDQVVKLYNERKQEFDEQTYKSRINEKLEFSDKTYTIIFPKKTSDIIDEGKNLSHCVGSYVPKVINGESIILFLRLKEESYNSLITLEMINKKITQARGKFNRALLYEEKEFVRKYCKEKNITLGLNF